MYNVKKPRPKQEYVFRISSFRLIRISYMYTISILLCLEFFFFAIASVPLKKFRESSGVDQTFSNVHFLLISYRFFLIVQSN
jgi:hypothetical protein